MAQKNPSRAEKAVTDAKKKSPVGQSSGKSSVSKAASTKKNTPKKQPVVKTEYERTSIPVNAIVALVSLSLFILFVIISINPEGALLRILQSFILGMIGQAGFYFMIPALLYLFVIHVLAEKQQQLK